MPTKRKIRKQAVQIEVRESGVHGRGVYTMQFIPKAGLLSNARTNASPGESAPRGRQRSTHFQFRAGERRCHQPGSAATTRAGSIILATQTVKPSRKMTASSSMPCATSRPADELVYDYRMQIERTDYGRSQKEIRVSLGRLNCRGTMFELQGIHRIGKTYRP